MGEINQDTVRRQKPRINQDTVRRLTVEGERFARETRPEEALARGIVRGPARSLEGMTSLIEASGVPTVDTGLTERFSRASEERAREIAPPPTNAAGRVIEAAGEGVIPGLIGGAVAAPFGGAVGMGPRALMALGEMGLSVATPAIGQGVLEATGDPNKAAIAELSTVALAPLVGLRAFRGPRMPQTGVSQYVAAQQARRVGRSPIEATGAQRRARRLEDAAALERSQQGIEDPRMGPTTAQVLRDQNPEWEILQAQKSQAQGRMSARMTERKRTLDNLQQERVNRAIGGDTVEPMATTRQNVRTRYDEATRANTDLWKQIDLDGHAPATDRHLQEAITNMRAEAGESLKKALPKSEIALINKFEGQIPWAEMQGLRHRLGKVISSSRGPQGGKWHLDHRGRYAAQLIEAIDKTIAETPDLATRYPAAIASHRALRETWDPKTRAFRAMAGDIGETRPIGEILEGRGGIQEARNIRAMLGDDSLGLNDFRTQVLHNTFADDTATPSQLRKRYINRRDGMSQLWTEEEMRGFDELVRLDEEARSTKAGSRAQAAGTGSANLTPEFMNSNWAGKLKTMLKNSTYGGDVLHNIAFENLMLDPAAAARMLRARMTNPGLASRLVTQYVIKTAAREAAYTNAVPESLSVETPMPEQ